MALRKRRPNRTYGIDNALQEIAPRSINANRAPTAADLAEIGQQWVDMPNGAVYVLASMTANVANWVTAPASGSETLSSLTVTGATDLQGNTTNGGTLDVTGTTTVADLDVTGTLTFTGDLDLTSAALIDLTSTLDADPSIYLHANGGTSEVIRLRSDQGTAVNSIDIVSDVGGITLQATGLASDDAINLNANAGGVDINAALHIDISSSENAADAIAIAASAGGIDILASGAAGEDIDIVNTGGSVNIASTEDDAGAVYIRANGGTSERVRLHSDQGTGVDSILLDSDVGGISLTATGLASDDAINLTATAGGVDIDGALQVNIASSENAADAVVIAASAGGIDISATGAAGEDIDITNTGGSVNVTATEDVADAIYIHANGGTSEKIRVHADQGTASDSIELESDAGGITFTSPATNGVVVNNGTQALGIYVGSGAPSLSAAQGSIYLRSDGSSTSTRLYVNTDGSTTWTNFTSAA